MEMPRRTLLALLLTSAGAAWSQTGQIQPTIRIRLDIGGQVLTATLFDNPTTRDLLSLLPLALTAKDFMSFEKLAYLPRKLTTQGAPASYTPAAGDVGYYDPWGNLAFFHDKWNPSPGLVLLGRFEGAIDVLRIKGDTPVRIAQVR